MNILPKRQEGQGLVEYALVLVLIAVVVIVILQLVGSSVVLAYAKVMGGFSGQTISNTGNEGIVVSYALNETVLGGGTCQGTVTEMFFVLTEDGKLVTDRAVTVTIGNGGSINVTIPGNGLGRYTGSTSFTGPCPATPTISW